MLVSLHLPKTAGSSFRASLQEHFGEGLRLDYGDMPMNTPEKERNRAALRQGLRHILAPPRHVACVHGHFLPLKYRWCRGARFLTWMRDPIERLASQFHYWKRNYGPHNVSILQTRLVEEDWSFERFCLGPEFHNLYRKYLWRFPVERFAFIGITEHYEEDLEYLGARLLGVPLANRSENRNPEQVSSYFEDPDLRRRVEEHHAEDVELYRRALEMRVRRMEGVAREAAPAQE